MEVRTSGTMRTSCSDVMLPGLHSCCLWKEKDCLALAEYTEHLLVVHLSPVSFQYLKALASKAFMETITDQW